MVRILWIATDSTSSQNEVVTMTIADENDVKKIPIFRVREGDRTPDFRTVDNAIHDYLVRGGGNIDFIITNNGSFLDKVMNTKTTYVRHLLHRIINQITPEKVISVAQLQYVFRKFLGYEIITQSEEGDGGILFATEGIDESINLIKNFGQYNLRTPVDVRNTISISTSGDPESGVFWIFFSGAVKHSMNFTGYGETFDENDVGRISEEFYNIVNKVGPISHVVGYDMFNLMNRMVYGSKKLSKIFSNIHRRVQDFTLIDVTTLNNIFRLAGREYRHPSLYEGEDMARMAYNDFNRFILEFF